MTNNTKTKRWNWFRIGLILVCSHFAISTLIWLAYFVLVVYWRIKGDHVIWSVFLGSVGPIILLSMTLFCMRIREAKKKIGRLLFGSIIVLSGLLLFYDVYTEAYQIQIATDAGCRHLYFTWWWFQF